MREDRFTRAELRVMDEGLELLAAARVEELRRRLGEAPPGEWAELRRRALMVGVLRAKVGAIIGGKSVP